MNAKPMPSQQTAVYVPIDVARGQCVVIKRTGASAAVLKKAWAKLEKLKKEMPQAVDFDSVAAVRQWREGQC